MTTKNQKYLLGICLVVGIALIGAVAGALESFFGFQQIYFSLSLWGQMLFSSVAFSVVCVAMVAIGYLLQKRR